LQFSSAKKFEHDLEGAMAREDVEASPEQLKLALPKDK
jgi:hypothetical protein